MQREFEHALVDAVLGKETMHIDGPRLPHPMTPRYRLLLDRRLPLRLGQEHDRRRLDVETDTASLDLADENTRGRRSREVVDEGLPLCRRDASCKWSHRDVA